VQNNRGIECARRNQKADDCKWVKRSGSVRDLKEIGIEECVDCGLVTHEVNLHIKIDYESGSMHDWSQGYGGTLELPKEDVNRRLIEMYKLHKQSNVQNLLDFGSGRGEMLQALHQSFNVTGLEPESEARIQCQSNGYLVFDSWDSINSLATKFDLVTMFHVIEHLYSPHEELARVHKGLKSGGLLVIETPNSNDALLTLYNSESFSNFTYWSHHPMLHSHTSLQLLVESCGFRVIQNVGHQRYNLANHLYWLTAGKPGGHEVMKNLFSENTNLAYAIDLEKIGKSDTIWLVAVKD